MRVILDASAAIEVVLRRSKASQFAELLEQADEVLAPDLLVAELANTMWKYHQFEKLELNACHHALDFGLGLVDVLVSCKDLYREAFLLSRTAQRPVYDMFYLALAQREDACLLTTDTGLKKEASRQGLRVF